MGEAFIKKISVNTISNIRFYVTGQNLFTFTNYSGYDPEIGSNDYIFGRGIDNGSVPQARTYLIGVQVGF
jgi:hypothetical protein